MKKLLLIAVFLMFSVVFSQENSDSIIHEVVVLDSKPITSKIIKPSSLSSEKTAVDFPILLKSTPSVVSTSDAGTGIGYTGLRLRGADQSRINVTINNIPLNDAESQNVFWVNLPDLASSTENIVIQRGLGTSSNGSSSFGGSINLSTLRTSSDSTSFKLAANYGSFDSQRTTFLGQFTPLEKFNISGRLSHVSSDGYVDRAFSKLWGYSLEVDYNSTLKFHAFGGNEKTYQAWYGVDASAMLNNRTQNDAGAIYDSLGKIVSYYDNQTDNYQQNHYQLHYENYFDEFYIHTALYYVLGNGFYEEYVNDQTYSDYGYASASSGDLVRQKWMKNHSLGLVLNLRKKFSFLSLETGIYANQYWGDHFGKVIKFINQPSLEPNQIYYSNTADKKEFSAYLKTTWRNFLPNTNLFADFQWRKLLYKTATQQASLIDDNPDFLSQLDFVNPKIGLDWKKGYHKLYLYYGLGYREPTRSDYINNIDIKPEQMQDLELGFLRQSPRVSTQVNLYWMNYANQLILTGKLDAVGNTIHENSGKSYRLGLEYELTYKFSAKYQLGANITWSKNLNLDYYTLDINGQTQRLGNTSIAFSPSLIANLFFIYQITPTLQCLLSNKYVSKQYLSSQNTIESQLKAYYLSDFSIEYQLSKQKPQIKANLILNNLFNNLYENNGYYYTDYSVNGEIIHHPFYYPQAGLNFFTGFQISF